MGESQRNKNRRNADKSGFLRDWDKVRENPSSVLASSQLVFASDYPQAVRKAAEVEAYVEAVRALEQEGRAIATGANAEKLIPDLKRRLAARPAATKVPA